MKEKLPSETTSVPLKSLNNFVNNYKSIHYNIFQLSRFEFSKDNVQKTIADCQHVTELNCIIMKHLKI